MSDAVVSIIIPVYNGEQFLRATIENALNQTWPKKEIIIVDDGSTDKSLAIAKEFGGAVTKIVSVPNGGAARARNIGFGMSTGKYIQYLDADDLIIDNKIELQMKKLSEEQFRDDVLCAGQWLKFNSNLNDTIGGIGPGGPAENDMTALDWLLLKPYNLMMVHAWLTPRALIEKAGHWDETMTLDDDGEFFIRVVDQASKVLFCKGALAYYRAPFEVETVSRFSHLANSQSNSAKLRSAYRSMETYGRVLSRHRSEASISALGKNYLFMAFHSYKVDNNVYLRCINQPEIPWFQRLLIYRWIRGKWGVVALLIGWKWTKRLMMWVGRN